MCTEKYVEVYYQQNVVLTNVTEQVRHSLFLKCVKSVYVNVSIT